jgi:phosphatidylglycerol:prolipoprotein diacylglycerol transferase
MGGQMNSLFTVPMNYLGGNYGIFYLFAFLVGSLIVLYEGYRRKWPLVSCFILMAWCSIWAIIGSKLIVIPLEEWNAALHQGSLPVTTEKSFLGGVLGGLLGVFFALRLLRFRFSVSDSFAFALPIGLAIGRIGCLIGGCCFGIPTSLPWAITYPANSHAYNIHLAKGLIGPDASTSLPIHPTQLYEIVFLLAIVAILLISRKRLKRSGSLFFLFIVLYSSLRFLEEFVREGGSAASGLKPEQWGLLLVFLSVSILLIWRERLLIVKPKQIQSTQEKLHRNAIAAVAVAPFLFLGRNWFTPLEMTTLMILALPAFIGITIQITRCLSKKYLRWAEITILLTSILFISTNFDTSTPNDDSKKGTYNLSIAGMLGEYVETCGGSHYYEVLGAGISHTWKPDQFKRFKIGIRGYFGSDRNGGSYQILGINPYLQSDSRWIGFGIGGHFGDLYFDGEPINSLLQASLRIGPYDKFFVEARFGDHYPGSIPAPVIKFGIGFGFKNEGSIRLGISDAGYYINPYIPLKRGAAISPFIAFGDENTYQFGLTLKFRLGKQ